MNILYIGPYRQNNLTGWHSYSVLSYLINKSNHNITSRPIYFTDYIGLSDRVISREIEITESNTYNKYDLIIQHAPIDYLRPINKIPKNIAIPIVSNQLLNSTDLESLSGFDSILVDSKQDYHKLCLYNKISNKIKTYDYSLNFNTIDLSKFNIGILNQAKKIYFIGDFQNNITNINNIYKSFIRSVSINDFVLLLFMLNMNYESKEYLESMIKQEYFVNNIHYSINRIITIPIETTIDNLVAAHSTGDIYLDIQDNVSNTLNCKIAHNLNKTIIEFDSYDFSYDFDRNNKTSNGFIGLSSKAILDKMQNIVNKTIPNNIKTKKQDLLQLI